MEYLYYGGLVLFTLLFVFKALLTIIYWKKTYVPEALCKDSQNAFSVVQPILSGDPTLEQNLMENLENLQNVKLIWLIDKSDHEAKRITRKIMVEYSQDRERVMVLEIDEIPANMNPKVYKLLQAMPYLDQYTVILDDDTVLGPQSLQQAVSKIPEGSLVTGIPVYKNQEGFFSQLVAAFVNANSLFTYLPMALLTEPKTINGMYYIASTATLHRLEAFQQITDRLCDDYEMAKLFRDHNIPIIQSITPCMIRTTVEGAAHYQKLMKRWMVFANRFLKENLSFAMLFIVILPSFMPLMMLLLSASLGAKFALVFFIAHLLKTVSYSCIRNVLTGTKEGLMAPCYEMAADYLQVFHFIHGLLFPKEIQWRTQTIRIDKDKVVSGG